MISSKQSNVMRKNIILLVVMLIVQIAYGQNQKKLIDVIYLKSGEVHQGMIIEMIPESSITIKTTNNNVLTFQIEDIARMTKEKESKHEIIIEEYSKRKLYIGFGLGQNIGIETLKAKLPDLDINPLTVGYRLTDEIGVVGSILLTQSFYSRNFIASKGYLIGPTFTLKKTNTRQIDFKLMIGNCVSDEYFDSDSFFSIFKEVRPISSTYLGTGLAFHFRKSESSASTLNIEYLYSSPNFEPGNRELNNKISNISIRFGHTFLIK